MLFAIQDRLHTHGQSIKDVQEALKKEGAKAFTKAWLEIRPKKTEPEPERKRPRLRKKPKAKVISSAPKKEVLPAQEAPVQEGQVQEAPVEEDGDIKVSKELVRALVEDLKALRQLIERIPD